MAPDPDVVALAQSGDPFGTGLSISSMVSAAFAGRESLVKRYTGYAIKQDTFGPSELYVLHSIIKVVGGCVPRIESFIFLAPDVHYYLRITLPRTQERLDHLHKRVSAAAVDNRWDGWRDGVERLTRRRDLTGLKYDELSMKRLYGLLLEALDDPALDDKDTRYSFVRAMARERWGEQFRVQSMGNLRNTLLKNAEKHPEWELDPEVIKRAI